MNSNKGFAVSTVLYALLIVFLMFTLVLIASYNASSDVLSSATKDLTENNSFTVKQVKPSDKLCGENGWNWYKTNTILQVKAPQGTFYWPKDWYNYDNEKGLIGEAIKTDYTYNGITATCKKGNGEYGSCEGLTLTDINDYLPYPSSAIKRFKRDELEYIYNILNKTISLFSSNYDHILYPDVIYDENLKQYYCNLSSPLNIKCFNNAEHSYNYEEFQKEYNPKYRCFKKINVKHCNTNSIFNTCYNYDTAIECTAKMTIRDTTDASFLYGIDSSGRELSGNRFIYVTDDSEGINFDQKDKFNFFVNPFESSGNTEIYDNEDNGNYFNVGKLKETLEYEWFSVQFTNKLINNNPKKIRLSNYCGN